jgi:hypothetical protein
MISSRSSFWADLFDRESRGWVLTIPALTLMYSLWLSSVKLFWSDELLEFFTDSKPDLHSIISKQLTSPFVTEPPLSHILLHGMLSLPFGHELDLRLISILAMLVTECCLFVLALRLTGKKNAAIFAMALPLVLTLITYAPESRGYSFLTASFAIALVGYERIVTSETESRAGYLMLIFLGLACGILYHYFGIFIPLLFLFAESVRALRRRKLDFPTVLTVAGSMLCFLLNVPQLAALKEFDAHICGGSYETRWGMISLTYLWQFSPRAAYALLVSDTFVRNAFVLLWGALVLTAIAICWIKYWRQSRTDSRAFVFLALVAATVLPVLSFFIGRFKSHIYVPRYNLPESLAIVLLLTAALAPALARRSVFHGAMAFLIGCFLLSSAQQIHHARVMRRDLRAEIADTADLESALSTVKDKHLYVEQIEDYISWYYYAPANLQQNLVQIYSPQREKAALGCDLEATFARNMRNSTSLPFITLEELQAMPGPHLFLTSSSAKSYWIKKELHSEGLPITSKGHAMLGDLVEVDFNNKSNAPATSAQQNSCVACP